MRFLKNLIGKKYVRLVVDRYAGKNEMGRDWWDCHCDDCGARDTMTEGELRRGQTRMCDCTGRPSAKNKVEKLAWGEMLRTGGICERWINSFKDFLKDMGPCPFERGLIVKIKRKGIFEKRNCRWKEWVKRPLKHSTKFQDLTGEQFVRLTAEEYGDGRWTCLCDCGSRIKARPATLKTGNTRSCGCLQLDRFSRKRVVWEVRSCQTGGELAVERQDATKAAWRFMLEQVKNMRIQKGKPKVTSAYSVKVCERWSSKKQIKDLRNASQDRIKCWDEDDQREIEDVLKEEKKIVQRGKQEALDHAFKLFQKDMGKCPSFNHYVERIDKRKGFYAKNCQWTIWDVSR